MPQQRAHPEDLFKRSQQRAVRVANLVLVSPLHTMPQCEERNRSIPIRRLIRCDEDDNMACLVLRGVHEERQKALQPAVDVRDRIAATTVMPVVAHIGRDKVIPSYRVVLQVAA